MLRKFAYNKIFRTTGMLILLVLLLLFPASKEYSLEEETTKKTISQTKKNEVFLIDKDGYVARCKVDISAENNEAYAVKLIELLILDGKLEEKIPNGFKGILPSNTKINSIKINEEKITVDLSSDILELTDKEDEKAIEAITYNLSTIDNIKYIYINVDGKVLNYLPNSSKYLNQPFSKQNGINKNINVTDYKNTTNTTIYYVNKNNTGYYYVPVTKVSNKEDDKIKIIVDELTSSHIYETNLMSFLNYNTKLLDYKITDDVLTLNFNNYLFDDASNKSILEEVIYSISLSVRDNYDVNEIVFSVNGEEITKSVIKNCE